MPEADGSSGATEQWVNDIHQGDARETLAEMPENSVHCVMTSPPYFGMRDYEVDGQIGLEDELREYIHELVWVGEEIRRVLRDDGNWWLNLGDSYGGSNIIRNGANWTFPDDEEYEDEHSSTVGSGRRPTSNFGRKNKMLVPHRVAIALQDSGWIVRSDAVWAKPSWMPDPADDRLSETKEFVFHLTPKRDYWFDLDPIREPHETDDPRVQDGNRWESDKQKDKGGQQQSFASVHPNGKNPGDLLEVNPKPFPEAHFAVYPPELCKKPIKSSCPENVCAECGAPYEDNDQQCGCDTDETEPGVVLDPFAGAGTTCLVAKNLGRRFIGIDLNPEYVAMAQKRVGVTVDEPERLLEDDETSITAFADGGELADE